MYIKCTTTFHLKTSVPMHWGLGPLRLAPVELGYQKPSRITLLWPTHQHECWRKHLHSASSFSPRSRELPQSTELSKNEQDRLRGRHSGDQWRQWKRGSSRAESKYISRDDCITFTWVAAVASSFLLKVTKAYLHKINYILFQAAK